MIQKGTRLYSLVHQTCPQCHEGKMFVHGMYSRRFAQMHQQCPVCGLDFVQEPSFYFGAMYVSYAVQVAVFVAVYFALRFTVDPDTWTYVWWMCVASLVVMPFNFRFSRVAWLNFFKGYKPRQSRGA